jgi:hypothetical protein
VAVGLVFVRRRGTDRGEAVPTNGRETA